MQGYLSALLYLICHFEAVYSVWIIEILTVLVQPLLSLAGNLKMVVVKLLYLL